MDYLDELIKFLNFSKHFTTEFFLKMNYTYISISTFTFLPQNELQKVLFSKTT